MALECRRTRRHSARWLLKSGMKRSAHGPSQIAIWRPAQNRTCGIIGYGSRRAALPQRAFQGGPEVGRSSVPSLMDTGSGSGKGQEPVVRRPSNATLLASLSECLAPELDDAGLERTKRPRVEDDAIVPIVTHAAPGTASDAALEPGHTSAAASPLGSP